MLYLQRLSLMRGQTRARLIKNYMKVNNMILLPMWRKIPRGAVAEHPEKLREGVYQLLNLNFDLTSTPNAPHTGRPETNWILL